MCFRFYAFKWFSFIRVTTKVEEARKSCMRDEKEGKKSKITQITKQIECIMQCDIEFNANIVDMHAYIWMLSSELKYQHKTIKLFEKLDYSTQTKIDFEALAIWFTYLIYFKQHFLIHSLATNKSTKWIWCRYWTGDVDRNSR